MKKVLVILGSVREGRNGPKVAEWAMSQLSARDTVDYEFVDLKEVALPFMDEPYPPMAGKPPVHQHTRDWAEKIQGADGFVFITPEYNGSLSPALKNAVDYLYYQWNDKPVGFIGYGMAGAKGSIEAMRSVAAVVKLKALDTQVGIGQIFEAFHEEGNIKPDHLEGDIEQLACELEAALEAGSSKAA